MRREGTKCDAGESAGDAAGDSGHPAAPLREAYLPLHVRALHVRVVLSYSRASRTKFLTLPQEVVDPVRRATQRYREARARLEKEGDTGLRGCRKVVACALVVHLFD